MNLGMTELIVIFAIILILFGGKRLPGLGKAIGDTIREFKKGIDGQDEPRQERQAQLPPREQPQIQTPDDRQNSVQSTEKDRNRQS